MPDFDAEAEAARLRSLRAAQRRHPFRRTRSRLDQYAGELLALHDQGLRPADLRNWLTTRHHLTVARSTVTRWLAKRLDERAASEQPRDW